MINSEIWSDDLQLIRIALELIRNILGLIRNIWQKVQFGAKYPTNATCTNATCTNATCTMVIKMRFWAAVNSAKLETISNHVLVETGKFSRFA